MLESSYNELDRFLDLVELFDIAEVDERLHLSEALRQSYPAIWLGAEGLGCSTYPSAVPPGAIHARNSRLWIARIISNLLQTFLALAGASRGDCNATSMEGEENNDEAVDKFAKRNIAILFHHQVSFPTRILTLLYEVHLNSDASTVYLQERYNIFSMGLDLLLATFTNYSTSMGLQFEDQEWNGCSTEDILGNVLWERARELVHTSGVDGAPCRIMAPVLFKLIQVYELVCARTTPHPFLSVILLYLLRCCAPAKMQGRGSSACRVVALVDAGTKDLRRLPINRVLLMRVAGKLGAWKDAISGVVEVARKWDRVPSQPSDQICSVSLDLLKLLISMRSVYVTIFHRSNDSVSPSTDSPGIYFAIPQHLKPLILQLESFLTSYFIARVCWVIYELAHLCLTCIRTVCEQDAVEWVIKDLEDLGGGRDYKANLELNTVEEMYAFFTFGMAVLSKFCVVTVGEKNIARELDSTVSSSTKLHQIKPFSAPNQLATRSMILMSVIVKIGDLCNRPAEANYKLEVGNSVNISSHRMLFRSVSQLCQVILRRCFKDPRRWPSIPCLLGGTGSGDPVSFGHTSISRVREQPRNSIISHTPMSSKFYLPPVSTSLSQTRSTSPGTSCTQSETASKPAEPPHQPMCYSTTITEILTTMADMLRSFRSRTTEGRPRRRPRSALDQSYSANAVHVEDLSKSKSKSACKGTDRGGGKDGESEHNQSMWDADIASFLKHGIVDDSAFGLFEYASMQSLMQNDEFLDLATLITALQTDLLRPHANSNTCLLAPQVIREHLHILTAHMVPEDIPFPAVLGSRISTAAQDLSIPNKPRRLDPLMPAKPETPEVRYGQMTLPTPTPPATPPTFGGRKVIIPPRLPVGNAM
ncbi:hypothetical protein SpCBS45565_g06054 [Spizellomyces sp. 'palustris']|nr:hypothetical protein SpCBS45565_g06054 [Spizellomyces sp. 'palustris']